eukprot:1146976-Pelagomonas_calceolata.AAC.1
MVTSLEGFQGVGLQPETLADWLLVKFSRPALIIEKRKERKKERKKEKKNYIPEGKQHSPYINKGKGDTLAQKGQNADGDLEDYWKHPVKKRKEKSTPAKRPYALRFPD